MTFLLCIENRIGLQTPRQNWSRVLSSRCWRTPVIAWATPVCPNLGITSSTFRVKVLHINFFMAYSGSTRETFTSYCGVRLTQHLQTSLNPHHELPVTPPKDHYDLSRVKLPCPVTHNSMRFFICQLSTSLSTYLPTGTGLFHQQRHLAGEDIHW